MRVKNIAHEALTEARFLSQLSKLLPSIDISLQPRAMCDSAAALFKLADPKRLAAFNAVAPASMRYHADSSVRSLCARLARGAQLRESLQDPSERVRSAALARLREVGEVSPDIAPAPDLSDVYYDSIAERLVNDYPDDSRDWVKRAIDATVRSHRSVSGVSLDAEKLADAVEKRLDALGMRADDSPLKEAIDALSESAAHERRSQPERSLGTSLVIERAALPIDVRKKMLDEHGVLAIDFPKRVKLTGRLDDRARSQLTKLVSTLNAKLRGAARASWLLESPRSALIVYRS